MSSTTTTPTSKPKPVAQAEFDMIVEENVTEFEMAEEEAISDALNQLKGRDVSCIAKTTEDKRKVALVETYCSSIEAVRENLDALMGLLDTSSSTAPLFLVQPIVQHGALGMAMHIAAKNKSVKACEFVQLLCESSSMARDVVPPVGLGVMCDLLTEQALLSRNGMKSCPNSFTEQTAFMEAVLGMLVAVMKQHEMNKRVLHEKGFSTAVNSLLVTCSINPGDLKTLLLCTTRAIRAYLQDDDDRPGAIEFDGFARGRKLGEETDAIAEIVKYLSVDDSLSATLRMICVNDNICRKALEFGALRNALEWIEDESAPSTKKSAGLVLVRHLCLNDDAKQKVGLDPKFVRALTNAIETGLDENDEPSLSAALSCLGVVVLRQPRCCDAFADQGAISLLIRALQEAKSTQSLKFALIALRNMLSHPSNEPLKQVALETGGEKACRSLAARNEQGLKDFIESCLRDMGVSNYHIS